MAQTRTTATDPAFEALLGYLRESRGFDFTGYKRPTLVRRVEKRMQAVSADGYPAYRRYLDDHPGEFVELFNTILINVTGFFRDRPMWEYLRAEIVPRIVRRDDEQIRIWSTGCATGEEAYSLAIVFAEALGDEAFRRRVKIYATDVDDDALAEGRHAIYSAKRLDDVSREIVDRYFEQVDDRYTVRPDLRRAVIFGRHDLTQDPPISRIDLLSSRNTLMYFTADAQARILANFHFALKTHGFLFLGKSEVLVASTNLFMPVDMRRRVFEKLAAANERAFAPRPASPALELAEESLRTATFEVSPVAQFVVDRDGNLVLANNEARTLFGLSRRDLQRPLQDFELSYRPIELRSQVDRARGERLEVTVRGIEWPTAGGEARTFDINIVPLTVADADDAAPAVSVSFTDVTRFTVLQKDLEESKREVEAAYEQLQSTNEELETTNEELQSTNEELETTNEELQSANEELETMNEELRSTNEELETINDEVNQRTDELNIANAFLESILSSVRAGVVVVDNELRITAWNDRSEEMWGVRRDDALGQHLLNLDIGLPVDKLRDVLSSTLSDGGAPSEVVLDAINRRGKPLVCKVVASALKSGEVTRGAILLIEGDE